MIIWYLILIPDAPILDCTDVWWHLAAISSIRRRLAVYGSLPLTAAKPRQQDQGVGCTQRYLSADGS